MRALADLRPVRTGGVKGGASARYLESRAPNWTHKGFTIVELLVVIGVVVVLVGMTMVVGAAAMERAEISRTRSTISILDMTVDAWQTDARRKVTWGTDGVPDGAAYDMQAETDEVFVITELLEVLLRSDEATRVFSRINGDLLHHYEAGEYPHWIITAAARNELDERFDGGLTVLDPWDTPIYALHPGRRWQPEAPYYDPEYRRDPDGTYRTDRELKYGVARNRRIAFVSAGPSGRFGSLSGPQYPGLEKDKAHTADNIYSYSLADPMQK